MLVNGLHWYRLLDLWGLDPNLTCLVLLSGLVAPLYEPVMDSEYGPQMT